MNKSDQRVRQAADELGIAVDAIRSAYGLTPAEMLMMVNMTNECLLSMLLIAEKRMRDQRGES